MLNRKFIISLHLYLAAIFTPMVIVMAVSGGLYLFGYKGTVAYTEVALLKEAPIDPGSDRLKADVMETLKKAGVEFEFEYVKVKGDHLYTRPTSRTFYRLELLDGQIDIQKGEPNLQSTLIELHKGHGPIAFKWLEKLFAIALVLIMLSGLYLGLQSPLFKVKTIALSGVGLLVFVGLALI